MLVVVLILGTIWSLKPARTNAERLLALLPCAPFSAAALSDQWIDGWAGVGCVLAGQLLSLLLVAVIGGRLRDRRMAEVIAAA